jgi:hypothetical protein
VASSGVISQDCGDASFNITQKADDPSSPTTTTTPTPPAFGIPNCYSGSPFKQTDAASKSRDFCNSAISGKWHWKDGDSPDPAGNGFYSGQASHVYNDALAEDQNQALSLMVSMDQNSCPSGAAYAIDFGQLGIDKCISNFMANVDNCEFTFLYFGVILYFRC